jgi:hypothetical protein
MKRTTAPPLGISKAYAGFEISPLDAGERPNVEFALDVKEIRWRLKCSNLSSREREILAFLRKTTRRYILSRELYEKDNSATPAQVRNYVSRLHDAVAQLRTILHPTSGPEKAILRRMCGAAFDVEDWDELSSALLRSADTLQDTVTKPTKGGWREADSQPRDDLAKAFWLAFKQMKMPMSTGPKSVMSVLLGIALQAAGEPHQQPYRLLVKARKELHA